MNDEKKTARAVRTERGLYIVLFICVAIVGIASWMLIYRELKIPENTQTMGYADGAAQTPAQTPGTDFSDIIKTPSVPIREKDEKDETPENDSLEQEDEPEQAEAETVEQPESKETAQIPERAPAEDKAPSFIWPLSGAIEVSYSMDELIFDKTMADWRTHDGIDLEAKLGTRVLAAANGTVEKVYDDDMLGTTVVISHSGGVKTVYSNLAGKPTVSEGDAVSCGDVIGSVGSTATAESGEVTHLHFAMESDGKSVDPSEYMPSR